MKIKFVTSWSSFPQSWVIFTHLKKYMCKFHILRKSLVSFCQNEVIYLHWHYPRKLWNYKDFQEMRVSVHPGVTLGRKKSLRLFIILREKGGNRVVLILHLTWQDNQNLKRVDLFFITDYLLLSLSSTTPSRILGTLLVPSIVYHSYSDCLYLFIWRIIQGAEVGNVWTKVTPVSNEGICIQQQHKSCGDALSKRWWGK